MKEVEELKDMEVIGSIPTGMGGFDKTNGRGRRIVAREKKDSLCTVDAFEHTTPWRGVRTLLAMSAVMKLKVAVFDASDAFLLVPQHRSSFSANCVRSTSASTWRLFIHVDLHTLSHLSNLSCKFWVKCFTSLCLRFWYCCLLIKPLSLSR